MDAFNELVKHNVKFSHPHPKGSSSHRRDRQNSEDAEAREQNLLNAATEAAWAKILEAMEKRDDKMVTGWKDEMNNLLIFAGLFSAVVTTFAAGSYQLLQQDEGQTTINLLGLISRQLSSSTVGPTFVNSTVPGATDADISPEFTPPHLAVEVNTLWFLSLALSLVAALFAIVVQQWLREYPVSGLRTVRECLRLRHFRYTNLNAWGVPHIVSVLPILVEAALVLFLVGLAAFLWSLNRTVAWPFIIFLALSGSFLVFTTLLPALSASCPYKSPLAEIVILAVRSATHLASLVLKAAGVLALTAGIAALAGLIRLQHAWRWHAGRADYVRQSLLNRVTRILVPRTWPFTRGGQRAARLFSEYWSTCDEDCVRARGGLDQAALMWAPSALPSNHWAQIHPCLQDCSREEVIECVARLVTQSFDVSGSGSLNALRYPASLALRHMDQLSVEQCRQYLFQALTSAEQDEDTRNGRSADPEKLEIDAHLVLYFLMCAQPKPSSAMRTAYIELLLKTRKGLRALGSSDGMYAHSRLRIITSALLECSTTWEHIFTLEDATMMASWASDVWTRIPLEPAQFWIDQACAEEFFGTIALALYAVEQHADLFSASPSSPSPSAASAEARDSCQSLLHCLNVYASANAPRLRALTRESVHVTFANAGFVDAACAAVCRALGALRPALAREPELMQLAVLTADRLAEMFGGFLALRDAGALIEALRVLMQEDGKAIAVQTPDVVLMDTSEIDTANIATIARRLRR